MFPVPVWTLFLDIVVFSHKNPKMCMSVGLLEILLVDLLSKSNQRIEKRLLEDTFAKFLSPQQKEHGIVKSS